MKVLFVLRRLEGHFPEPIATAVADPAVSLSIRLLALGKRCRPLSRHQRKTLAAANCAVSWSIPRLRVSGRCVARSLGSAQPWPELFRPGHARFMPRTPPTDRGEAPRSKKRRAPAAARWSVDVSGRKTPFWRRAPARAPASRNIRTRQLPFGVPRRENAPDRFTHEITGRR